MTWTLVLLMLGSSFAWPESYATRATCEAAGAGMVAHQDEVVIIDGYRCDPVGSSTPGSPMENRG